MERNDYNKPYMLKQWFSLKELMDEKAQQGKKIPKITEAEVWWVAVGENIGIEMNGKSEFFSRPTIIFKKLNHLAFMGIPLSAKGKDDSWHVSFEFQNKRVYAALSQARVFSTARLYSRLGEVTEANMKKIREGFRNLYIGE